MPVGPLAGASRGLRKITQEKTTLEIRYRCYAISQYEIDIKIILENGSPTPMLLEYLKTVLRVIRA